MKFFMLSFIILLGSCVLIRKTNTNSECFLPWISLFENYILLNPGSENMNSDSNNSSCYNDTLTGITYLSKNLFYGSKSKGSFDYRPTYLIYSTSQLNLDSLRGDINSSTRLKGALKLPTEMIKIYFIHSLFKGDFEFKNRVLLGYKGSDVVITAGDLKTNSLIIKEAEKSLSEWLELATQKGLNHVRTNNIDPLFYSNLEWK